MTSNDFRTAAKDMAAGAAETVAQAAEAGTRAFADAGERAGDALHRASDAAEHLYGRARHAASDIGGSAEETLEAGRRAYVRGSDQLGRQVARQPIEALLLAGAIGYLVGWAANRG